MGLDSVVSAVTGISFLENQFIAPFLRVRSLDTDSSRVIIFSPMNQTENLYISANMQMFVQFVRVIGIVFSVAIPSVACF